MTATGSSPMLYEEREPRPESKPWVAALWRFRVDPGADPIEHSIPLTGGAMLSFPLGGPAVLFGPRASPLRETVRGGDVVRGVHFWPGAAAPLLGVGGDDLRERIVPARSVLSGDWLSALEAALGRLDDDHAALGALDSTLAGLEPNRPLDQSVMETVFAILAAHGQVPASTLASEAGLSKRQLRRRFRREVGLSQQELRRIERLRDSATIAVRSDGPSWVEIAAEHGFADQPHLVREYRRLLGLTPGGFARHAGRIRHERIVR